MIPRRARSRHISRAVRHTCALFGIAPDLPCRAPGRARLDVLAAHLDAALGPGGIALVTGPSGSGKTLFLHAVRRRVEKRGPCGTSRRRFPASLRAVEVLLAAEPAPDETRRGGAARRDRVLSLLSRAGLADARVMVRRVEHLSAGEHFRLCLAQAFQEADRAGAKGPDASGGSGDLAGATPGLGERPATVILDEFCSVLDRQGAAILARVVHRWAKRSGVRVVAATAHDDLLEALEPDTLVVFDGCGEARVVARVSG